MISGGKNEFRNNQNQMLSFSFLFYAFVFKYRNEKRQKSKCTWIAKHNKNFWNGKKNKIGSHEAVFVEYVSFQSFFATNKKHHDVNSRTFIFLNLNFLSFFFYFRILLVNLLCAFVTNKSIGFLFRLPPSKIKWKWFDRFSIENSMRTHETTDLSKRQRKWKKERKNKKNKKHVHEIYIQ